MFELKTPTDRWDGRTVSGTAASDGVYYILLKAKGTDKKEYDKKGAFTLVR